MQKSFYEQILNTIDIDIVVLDADCRYIFISPNAIKDPVKRKEIIGKTELEYWTQQGRNVEAAHNREKYMQQVIKENTMHEFEETITNKNGETLIFMRRICPVSGPDGKVVNLIGYGFNITDRKKVEYEKEQLQNRIVRAEKMEALGLLAGSVAHDLNNILTSLMGYPDLLLLKVAEDSKLKKPLLTIKRQAKKAGAIVQDMLTLARRGISKAEIFNINEIVTNYFSSPEHYTLMSNYPRVRIEHCLEKELNNIRGSEHHVRAALLNVMTNAVEATPDNGTVTVTTENVAVGTPIKGYDTIKKGEYAVLKISDTGSGIAQPHVKKIFEPFYTRKVMGRSGTGLGLSVVWSTVHDHDGYIDMQSSEEKGTALSLYFPTTPEEVPDIKMELSLQDYRGSGETILVVDDAQDQRELLFEMLCTLDYTVAAVPSGEAAVEYMKAKSAELVVLDMVLDSGIDGLETYKRILKVHPRQKAMIVSGSSESDRIQAAQKLGARQHLKKPYTLETLGVAVKSELHSTVP